MDSIPAAALPLLLHLAPAFTQPTFRRAVVLLFAALLTLGRRTVHNLLRTAGILAPGDSSSYRRVLSQASWSGLRLAAALTRFVVTHYCPAGVVRLVGDDTVDEHRGKKVYGKARHRDPIRSSHCYTTYRYGHKWVVVAILIRFAWATRPWALPVLVVLYRSPKDNAQRRQPHQTPAELVQLQLRLLLRWLPDRSFVFAGDQGYGSHALASFAAQQQGRLTLVSRFYADANLYEPPPRIAGKRPAHRPRKKGAKQPPPQEVVAATAAHAVERRLVRRRSSRRRSGDGCGPLVQEWRGLGSGTLGLCPRRYRDAPGRLLVQHRRDDDRRGHYRDVHGALEHRDHVPGDARLSGSGDDAWLVPADGAAGRSLLVRAVYGGGGVVCHLAVARDRHGRGAVDEQSRSDVLRRHNHGAAVVVDRVGICTARS